MKEQHTERGLVLYRAHQYPAAEKEFRAALAENPNDDYAHRLLAFCLKEQKRLGEAVEEARQAVALNPESADNYYGLAVILNDQKQWKEAQAAIDEAKALAPQVALFHAEDARLALQQGRWQEALAKADRALSLNPLDEFPMRLKAWALLKTGKYKEAEESCRQALALNPESASVFAVRGHINLARSKVALAIADFREALRIDPTQNWAREGLFESLRRRNPLYGVVLHLQWMGGTVTSSAMVLVAVVIGGIMRLVGPHLLLVMMRCDRVACAALAPDEIAEANLLLAWLIGSYILGCVSFVFFLAHPVFFPFTCLLFAMPLAFTRIFELKDQPHQSSIAKKYCIGLAALGMAAVVCTSVGPNTLKHPELPWNIADVGSILSCLFLLLAFLTRFFCRPAADQSGKP
jgi:tetratricopeptide (TPR) repeat protein